MSARTLSGAALADNSRNTAPGYPYFVKDRREKLRMTDDGEIAERATIGNDKHSRQRIPSSVRVARSSVRSASVYRYGIWRSRSH